MPQYPRNQENLTLSESNEVDQYIKIYREHNFQEHYEVNAYITRMNLWDSFPSIRSLNDHGDHKQIPGILPRLFGIICKRLNIGGSGGTPLDGSTPY